MESAHTGQVGKSHPRGSGLEATVDRTSATAGIVTSLRSEPKLDCDFSYTLILYTDFFDDVATQMRSFDVICDHFDFAMQRMFDLGLSLLRTATCRS
jgi:hypothetical protein